MDINQLEKEVKQIIFMVNGKFASDQRQSVLTDVDLGGQMACKYIWVDVEKMFEKYKEKEESQTEKHRTEEVIGEKEKKIIRSSIQAYGEALQSIVCMEECAELTQAVSKQLRGRGNRENLVEEMADVLICIELLKQIYGVNESEVKDFIEKKIERMEKRLPHNM